MLKRVLLAYARWNKSIGYCQGFNMLAAIVLEVMEKAESDALKVMIFMIEGILPENYFSSNLRGLSVDMAVFRDLMKLRLPKLSKHLDDLQNDANDGVSRKFLFTFFRVSRQRKQARAIPFVYVFLVSSSKRGSVASEIITIKAETAKIRKLAYVIM